MNCWEFMGCEEDRRVHCPAYPISGQSCWRVVGTICDGEVQGSFAEKLSKCLSCDFRRTMYYKELVEPLS